LPLPSHRPLSSFTAEELYRGVQQAVVRERNLSSPVVKLKTYSRITWPYSREGSQDETSELNENHMPTSYLLHPNGDWIFLITADGIFRILSSRSGKVAYIQDLKEPGTGIPSEAFTVMALEVKNDSEVLLSMALNLLLVHPFSLTNTDLQQGSETSFICM
jgi:hypothetical protein